MEDIAERKIARYGALLHNKFFRSSKLRHAELKFSL